MATYKLIECDYEIPGDPAHYPHHLEIDGNRMMTDARYEEVLRFLQRNAKDDDIVIEQYHTGNEIRYNAKKFLFSIQHTWRFSDGCD